MSAQLPHHFPHGAAVEDLLRFTELVFGYCEGQVAVRMLRETGTPDAPPRSLFLSANGDLQGKIAAQVIPAAKDTRGLYVVPCTVKDPGNARADNLFQTCVIPCDLDHGDIAAKQAHLERHLGPASMVVLSGGRTEQGQSKRHLYWRLNEACRGTDLDKVVEMRLRIIAAVAADRAFEKLTQPIRVAGSIHGKNGKQTPVQIEAVRAREYDLDELLEAAMLMPLLPGLTPSNATPQPNRPMVSFEERQTRQVRAGGADVENRYEAISGTIGHWIRQVRLGNVTLEDSKQAVADYNVAMVVPPWEADRIAREFDALLALDRDNYADIWRHDGRSENSSGALIAAPDHSEDALAEAFVAQHGADWRYVAPWGSWFHWTGTHWEVDETQQVQDEIRGICRMGARDLKPGEACRIASARTIKAVARIASSDRRVALGTSEWDTHPDLLNTPAGTINLETGEIVAARREHHLTQITGASPGPTAPAWMVFLGQITGGDRELMDYLARVCGYWMTGDTSEQAFFFFHGDGSNGKSVFIRTIASALGSYAATAALDTFTVGRTNSHPTDLAGLRGKRLVTVTETEQGRFWAESRIKTITGGEPIRARLLYRDFFEFLPSFKLVVVGNHRPQLTSVGPAMRRRLQMVPFAVTIPEDRRDRTMAERLERELDGVLGWILAGYKDWKQKGLAPPDSVVRASEDYFSDEDLIGQWIGEQCVVGARCSAPAKVLYDSWSTWADGNGVERGSKKLFGEALRSRNFVSKHTRAGSLWLGLSLRRTAGV